MIDTSKMKEFDIANHINSPKEVCDYLNAAFDEGSANIGDAWDDVSRSKGMAILLKQAKQDETILQQNAPTNFVGMLKMFKLLGLSLRLVDKKSIVHR